MKKSIMIVILLMCSIGLIAQYVPPSMYGASTDCSTNGGFDGTCSVTVIGGQTPYHFQWSNGSITQNLTGLSVGTYYLTFTDGRTTLKNQLGIVQQPVKSNAMFADPNNAVLYDFTTKTLKTTVSPGAILIPLPDSLFKDAKLYLTNGATSGKLDLRKNNRLTQYIKNERVYFSLHGKFQY
jgi:hypothetical protein